MLYTFLLIKSVLHQTYIYTFCKLNKNKYQEFFLGVKATGALGWQPYHLYVPIVMKSGSLSFLEPSGPVKACNGIALPLHLPTHLPLLW